MNNKKVILSALALASVVGAQAAKKPNIIFILADDLGYGDVSCFDKNNKLNTEHIDKLSSEGVIFRDAHTSSSVSTPTRYGIMTGRYNWRSTLKKNVIEGFSKALIPQDRATMASMLKSQGYKTAMIGKWHLGWDWTLKEGTKGTRALFNIKTKTDNIDYSKDIKNGPTTLGFDYSYAICGSHDMPPYVWVENSTPTDDAPTFIEHGMRRKGLTGKDLILDQTLINITDRSVNYIGDNAKSKEPFFLYVPMTAPHTPIVPAAEFLDKSGIGKYGDFVLMVDVMVGRILDAVDKAGIKNNTLIVFTSDNGCSSQANIPDMIKKGHSPNSIYRGHKTQLYEGGHRVPLIVRYPDGFKAHDVEQTVCLNDFYATFADMVDYKLLDSEGEDSYSLLPALKSVKEIAPIREATVHHSQGGQYTIRKGDWKLLMCSHAGGGGKPKVDPSLPAVQLFNLKDDVSETTNVQDKHPEIVEELRTLLEKYIKDGRSTPGAPQKNDGKFPWIGLEWMK